MLSRDDRAQAKFGCNFADLSEWGKAELRREENLMNEPLTFDHVDMARALQEAQAKVAKLERENRDLWEENEELQLRLMGYDEDNLSRDAGQRQARSRVRTDEVVSNVPAQAVRLSDRIDNEDNE